MRGQSLIELVSVFAVLLPVVLVLIDLGVVAIAVAVNDNVCRDAARAASSGPPGTYTRCEDREVGENDPPKRRAVTVIQMSSPKGDGMKVRDNALVTETIRNATAGDAVDGYMTVETIMDVSPPFLVRAIAGSQVHVKARHKFPITYVVPTQIGDGS
jgi:hypothetical protein